MNSNRTTHGNRNGDNRNVPDGRFNGHNYAVFLARLAAKANERRGLGELVSEVKHLHRDGAKATDFEAIRTRISSVAALQVPPFSQQGGGLPPTTANRRRSSVTVRGHWNIGHAHNQRKTLLLPPGLQCPSGTVSSMSAPTWDRNGLQRTYRT